MTIMCPEMVSVRAVSSPMGLSGSADRISPLVRIVSRAARRLWGIIRPVPLFSVSLTRPDPRLAANLPKSDELRLTSAGSNARCEPHQGTRPTPPFSPLSSNPSPSTPFPTLTGPARGPPAPSIVVQPACLEERPAAKRAPTPNLHPRATALAPTRSHLAVEPRDMQASDGSVAQDQAGRRWREVLLCFCAQG